MAGARVDSRQSLQHGQRRVVLCCAAVGGDVVWQNTLWCNLSHRCRSRNHVRSTTPTAIVLLAQNVCFVFLFLMHRILTYAICRYALMIQCWSLVPADRPTFTTIHASLKDQQLEPHTDPGAVLVLSDDDDEEGTAL